MHRTPSVYLYEYTGVTAHLSIGLVRFLILLCYISIRVFFLNVQFLRNIVLRHGTRSGFGVVLLGED